MFGPPCPVNAAHGGLYPLPGGRWYCAHVDHDGRSEHHPSGYAPRTRAIFTEQEV